MTETLGDKFQLELKRVKGLLELYRGIPTGAFGATILGGVVARAEEAWNSQDLVEMIKILPELEGCE